MKIIQELAEMISCELGDAEHYINRANIHKETYPDVARILAKLSDDEIRHSNELHDIAAEMISDYRRIHGEPPAEMQAVYDYLHEKEIEKAADIRIQQEFYRK